MSRNSLQESHFQLKYKSERTETYHETLIKKAGKTILISEKNNPQNKVNFQA